MDHPEGADKTDDARLGFDRRVRLEFQGAKLSSDGGLLVMRELDDALGLSDLALGGSMTAAVARTQSIGSTGCSGNRSMVGLRATRTLTTPIAWLLIRSASGCRWPCRRCAGGLGLADGPVRDRDAGHARESGGAGRPERAMDRPLP